MSIEAITVVWKHSKSKLAARLVLLAIADFADDNFEAWPAVETIATKSKLSERNTRTCIRNLESMGELKTEKNAGRNGSNRYTILLQPGGKVRPPEKSDTTGGETQHPSPDRIAPNPSKGTVIYPSSSSGAGAPPAVEQVKAKDDRHQTFMDLWAEAYALQFGRDYVFNGGRDGKALKLLLQSTRAPAGELMTVATRAWSKKGRQFFRCEKAVTIFAFCGSFVEIVHELEQVRPGDIKPAQATATSADPEVAALYEAPK